MDLAHAEKDAPDEQDDDDQTERVGDLEVHLGHTPAAPRGEPLEAGFLAVDDADDGGRAEGQNDDEADEDVEHGDGLRERRRGRHVAIPHGRHGHGQEVDRFDDGPLLGPEAEEEHARAVEGGEDGQVAQCAARRARRRQRPRRAARAHARLLAVRRVVAVLLRDARHRRLGEKGAHALGLFVGRSPLRRPLERGLGRDLTRVVAQRVLRGPRAPQAPRRVRPAPRAVNCHRDHCEGGV
mmetsp:Transcript_1116/g.4406  ORF Transcript_1116/g.4406 Transcript_1116/m.4406 type:complete len:239 (+) Transcript_1116:759-1475(+)